MLTNTSQVSFELELWRMSWSSPKPCINTENLKLLMCTQMDVWLNLDLFQGKIRNKDRSKVPKVSGLGLMSEAKNRYKMAESSSSWSLWFQGSSMLLKIMRTPRELLFIWVYLMILIILEIKTKLKIFINSF